MAANQGKKAILVVSFGTTYQHTLQSCIESIEDKVRSEFPEFEVRRAFTSQFIINKLAKRDNIYIDDTAKALQRLKDEGFATVVVQPTHIIAGHEFDEVKAAVESCRSHFPQIVLGRPVLYFDGSNGEADDYAVAVDALSRQLPAPATDRAVALMGHGSSHQANQAYYRLQEKLDQLGLNVFLANVDETPTIQDIMAMLAERDIKHVTMMPYMLVAGDHAINDMAGDGEDTWKTLFEQAGYTTDACLKGLGENKAYQEIYIQHIKDALRIMAVDTGRTA